MREKTRVCDYNTSTMTTVTKELNKSWKQNSSEARLVGGASPCALLPSVRPVLGH